MLLRKILPLTLLLVHFNHPLFADTGPPQQNRATTDEGIRFSCRSDQFAAIESDMETYLASLGIPPDWVVTKLDRTNGIAVYTLNTPPQDTNTLDLKDRSTLQIEDDIVSLPANYGKEKKVQTVSKKEILLALLQHGRLTEFTDGACEVKALQEHVGLRQDIAAWAENLNWIWPNGKAAKWNNRYWRRGTPRPGFPLDEALGDAFINQRKYSIGCYTAAKLVVVQGILDYYRRIQKDPAQLAQLEKRLYLDNDPLVDIEPGKMWDFEKDFVPQERHRPGKLLKITYGVAPQNFVPGDWVYFQNPDSISNKFTGYEGANPIYLGRNRFADYFNDNRHGYTYRQKMEEVYQWKNGVFSRSRDFAKLKPVALRDLQHFGKTPAEGGMLRDFRVFPYFFGYEALPVWGAPASPSQIVRASANRRLGDVSCR